MTAKDLTPGMQLHTPSWGVCTVLSTLRVGKWLMVEVRDAGSEHVLAKFPNSLVMRIAEEAHQP